MGIRTRLSSRQNKENILVFLAFQIFLRAKERLVWIYKKYFKIFIGCKSVNLMIWKFREFWSNFAFFYFCWRKCVVEKTKNSWLKTRSWVRYLVWPPWKCKVVHLKYRVILYNNMQEMHPSTTAKTHLTWFTDIKYRK